MTYPDEIVSLSSAHRFSALPYGASDCPDLATGVTGSDSEESESGGILDMVSWAGILDDF